MGYKVSQLFQNPLGTASTSHLLANFTSLRLHLLLDLLDHRLGIETSFLHVLWDDRFQTLFMELSSNELVQVVTVLFDLLPVDVSSGSN